MLPAPHFQVVFTLPSALRPLAAQHPKTMLALLMRTAADLVKEAVEQRHGVQVGITAVLHTWTRELTYHPHVHLLVTAGGREVSTRAWKALNGDYLLPQKLLGARFRGRFLERLIDMLKSGDLQLSEQATVDLRSTVRRLAKRHRQWVVHVEPPKGRSVAHIAKYLARYVKRVALSDNRVLCVTEEEVTIRTRTGELTLSGVEFVRRFALHVLPSGFRKVRHFGLYASGAVSERRRMEEAIAPTVEVETDEKEPQDSEIERKEACPDCGGHDVWHLMPWADTPERLRRILAKPPRGPP